MKKLISVCVVASLVGMMGMEALAAPTYTTTTKYAVSDATNKIEVKTDVSNVEAGDMLTYLAHRDDAINKDTIVYIDQIEVEAGKTTASFVYTTDTTDINATVISGGIVDGAAITPTPGMTIPGYSVTAPSGTTVTVPTDNAGALYPVTPETGKHISIVKLGNQLLIPTDYEIQDNMIRLTESVDGNATLTVEFATNATENRVQSSKQGARKVKNGTKDQVEVAVLGKVETSDSDVQYGIQTADDVEFKTNFNEYVALGKGSDGSFAVQLIDEDGTFFTSSSYYTRVYVKNGDVYTYGPTKLVTIPASE